MGNKNLYWFYFSKVVIVTNVKNFEITLGIVRLYSALGGSINVEMTSNIQTALYFRDVLK